MSNSACRGGYMLPVCPLTGAAVRRERGVSVCVYSSIKFTTTAVHRNVPPPPPTFHGHAAVAAGHPPAAFRGSRPRTAGGHLVLDGAGTSWA